ncbi:FtsX-like permease family protein [Haladaptatus sp. CMAA 1911]|uniref:FtsX-like permease family protein n=1 Tax=unclassified Haladaptatus TaxID=2622732 RepID=UPI00375400AD
MTLYNPWQTEIDERITLSVAGSQYTRDLTVGPGEYKSTTLQLSRAAPGSYTVRMGAAGQTLDTATYSVTGDERIVTAYANRGAYSGGSGIGRILETAFGNLSFLVGILSLLAGIMTIGSTTAMFAQAIHARRQAIGVHRATGGSPRQIATLVLSDAFKIGVVATGIGLVSATVLTKILASSGFLTVFGIQITSQITFTVVGIVIFGELMIVLLSALLVILDLLRKQPVSLFNSHRPTPEVNRDSLGEYHG